MPVMGWPFSPWLIQGSSSCGDEALFPSLFAAGWEMRQTQVPGRKTRRPTADGDLPCERDLLPSRPGALGAADGPPPIPSLVSIPSLLGLCTRYPLRLRAVRGVYYRQAEHGVFNGNAVSRPRGISPIDLRAKRTLMSDATGSVPGVCLGCDGVVLLVWVVCFCWFLCCGCCGFGVWV